MEPALPKHARSILACANFGTEEEASVAVNPAL